MSWITPKTNWKVTVVNGIYVGDYFGYTDYNRIKNNIIYLAQMPEPSIPISSMGEDKVVGDLIFADDLNRLERNLNVIASAVGVEYEDYHEFFPNGNTPTFEDLNQIESFCLVLYEILSDSRVYAIDTNNLYALSSGVRATAEGS